MKIKYSNGIELEDVVNGILVRQYDLAYVARNWQLTKDVDRLVSAALDSGMRWMIRDGHPQTSALWPAGRGRVYLGFSVTRENLWSFAIDQFRSKTGTYGDAIFSGKYREQFRLAEIPFTIEKRATKMGHLVVSRENVLDTIFRLREMDHSVLYRTKAERSGPGFHTEYDIQRAVMLGWRETPFRQLELVGDEVPVANGANPPRIDLLARDSNRYVVIELKRAGSDRSN